MLDRGFRRFFSRITGKSRNFSNVMWMLVQKEDERESEKNAKFYK